MNFDSVVFYTNNIEESISFYRDIIGLKLEYQQGDRYASFVFPNSAKLGINTKDSETKYPGHQTVIISIETDIEEFSNGLKAKGVNFIKELTSYDWGQNFSVADPDGNKVEFVQRPKQ